MNAIFVNFLLKMHQTQLEINFWIGFFARSAYFFVCHFGFSPHAPPLCPDVSTPLPFSLSSLICSICRSRRTNLRHGGKCRQFESSVEHRKVFAKFSVLTGINAFQTPKFSHFFKPGGSGPSLVVSVQADAQKFPYHSRGIQNYLDREKAPNFKSS